MASFICQECREKHGSELDDEDDYLIEEDEELSDEEQELEDEELDDDDEEPSIETNNHLKSKISPPSPTTNNNNNKRKSSVINNSSPNNLMNGNVKLSPTQKATKKQKVEDQKQTDDDELYCICKTPYNESQFYVQCGQCNEWFHGIYLFFYFSKLFHFY